MSAQELSVQSGGRTVVVTRSVLVSEDVARAVMSSSKFTAWLARVDPRLGLTRVHLNNVVMFGKKHVGFVDLDMHMVRDGKSTAYPKSLYLAGGVVVVLLIITCEGKDYVIFTRQERPAVGLFSMLGLPAGRLDESEDPLAAAVREIAEETGIAVLPERFHNMTALMHGSSCPGSFSSCGLTDEYTVFFAARHTMSHEELLACIQMRHGVAAEGEHIAIELFSFEEAATQQVGTEVLAAFFLYNLLLQRGQIRA